MNKKYKKENLKIIYDEILRARKAQEKDIELIYNKFNWILVSNIVVLVGSLQFKESSFLLFLGIIFIIASTTFSLYFLRLNFFKRGPKLNDLKNAKNVREVELINALNDRIVSAINKNKDTIDYLGVCLKESIRLFSVGILLIFIHILIINLTL